MFLWIALALVVSVVTFALTRPLGRDAGEGASAQGSDVEVYRDQLAELESDAGRGVISPEEANAARVEVARRLLASSSSAVQSSAGQNSNISNRFTLALSGLVPVASIAVYLIVGQPTMPSKPYAERMAAPLDTATPGDLIARAEAELRTRPDDGRGWDALAPIYLGTGRYNEAADAFSKALKMLGETPARLAGFAEARVRGEDGMVPAEARQAYERLLELDPKRVEARFWIALSKEQDGKLDQALADYKKLQAEIPADTRWRGALEQRLRILEAKVSGKPAEAVKADGEQLQAIRAFAEGLKDQLKTDAGAKDLSVWVRLVRAHKILGERAEAEARVEGARRQFADNPQALELIEKLAASLKTGT